jgi:phospholipase C
LTAALLATTIVPAQAVTPARPQAQPGHGQHLSARQMKLLAELKSKVKYVFVFYQENRSFDSMFGTFPGANGIYSQPSSQTPGFNQTIYNTDGSISTISPFRIAASPWYAADLDDGDHSHGGLLSAEDIQSGVPLMDGYALDEENKYTPGVSQSNPPSEQAKQYAEMVMGHIDCDTTPLMWNYANKFTLFDNVFQTAPAPSTPGNITIFTGQTGLTQLEEHPSEAYSGNGNSGIGVPDLNDANPFWGSALDPNSPQNKMPYNPGDNPNNPEMSLTFASLPLTLAGKQLANIVASDRNSADLADVQQDVSAIAKSGLRKSIDWGWWEEGFDHEVTDGSGPASHNSYVTHHNGPQYFGYLSDNPVEQTHFHGLGDLYSAITSHTLPKSGGVYWVKGGFTNLFGLTPTDPDPAVQ